LPIRIYGTSSFDVTVSAFDVNRFGRTVQQNQFPFIITVMYISLSLSLPVSFNLVNNDIVRITAPPQFFSTYDANQNTSYFEIIFVAPSGSNASVSFSVEYFGMCFNL